ncbi:hypothetical protein DFH27DRAFT_521775 [Peziza echinospora]|nr:hypothetical protein DFH27DRAFT_521775 [Peziza echinospora]
MGSPVVQKRGRGFTSRMDDGGELGRLEPPSFSDEEEQRMFTPRHSRPQPSSSRPVPSRAKDSDGGVGVPALSAAYPASPPHSRAPAAAAESPSKREPRDRDGIQRYIPGARRRALSTNADVQAPVPAPSRPVQLAEKVQSTPTPIVKLPAATGLSASRYAPANNPPAAVSAPPPHKADARRGAEPKPQQSSNPPSQQPQYDLQPMPQYKPAAPRAPKSAAAGKGAAQAHEAKPRNSPRPPKDAKAFPLETASPLPKAALAADKPARAKPPSKKALTDAMKKLPSQHAPVQATPSQHAPSQPAASPPVSATQPSPPAPPATVQKAPLPGVAPPTISAEIEQLTETITSPLPGVASPTTSAEIEQVTETITSPLPGVVQPTISAEIEQLTETITSYQLAEDERYLTESSDSSESLTSSLGQYEPVSDDEGRVKKAIDDSPGQVNYPIAENEPPYVPLSFQIPESEMVRLLSLNDDSKHKFWSHSQYTHDGKKITVECCSTFDEIEIASQKFLNEKAIGFDMEWLSRPSKKVWDNVSLLQIAKEDHIALIHLARIKKSNVEELIPPTLRQILESKTLLKLGVAIGGDGGRLHKWLGIEVQGLMELSAIHHMNEYARERRRSAIPKVLVSLAKLSNMYLKLPIAKGSVRISDWTKPLDKQQISYAASDAYAGLRIYDALQQERMKIDPIPELPPAKTPVKSTWDVTESREFQLAGESSYNATLDWATMVEESEAENIAAQPITPAKKIRKKSASVEGKAASKKKSDKPALSSDMQFALEWSDSHKTWRKHGTCTAAPLKAYALWYHRNYDVEVVADLMGIQPRTAAQYITTAVKLDQLEAPRKRIDIVWSYLPRPIYNGQP